MITRAGIETAYCFLHQKERVYAHSSFADDMNPELYSLLADGRTDFLRSHATFHADMLHALDILEKML